MRRRSTILILTLVRLRSELIREVIAPQDEETIMRTIQMVMVHEEDTKK
jgi:hypothetical protein